MTERTIGVTERPYFSIGEVLGLLLEEFPDVTISKIRFLESQGLIDPERTPSGYRKFYDGDIERLRFILREQKENYLPLKVIKERLDGIDRHPAEPTPSRPRRGQLGDPERRAQRVGPGPGRRSGRDRGDRDHHGGDGHDRRTLRTRARGRSSPQRCRPPTRTERRRRAIRRRSRRHRYSRSCAARPRPGWRSS